MKKLFALLLVSVLTSFFSTPSKSSTPISTSNTDYEKIIGKPIKFGNLEVAQYNFPKAMKWGEAKKVCEVLGKGWRLPTKFELNTLYQNKDKIGGFLDEYYWSSTSHSSNEAWWQYFKDGEQSEYNQDFTFYVRVIRVLTSSNTVSILLTDFEKIIGKPIKFGNLEVAQYNFPNVMNWYDAKEVCEVLGKGWRLPTTDELNTLYQNKDKIGGFADSVYWSSTEGDVDGSAWFQNFKDGEQDNFNKNFLAYYVRPVRDF